MSQSNVQVLESYLDAYNRGDWGRLGEYVTAAYVHRNNDAELDLAAFTRGAQWLRAGLPDLRIKAKALVVDGDTVAARWEAAGTHSASLAGEAPTGRGVTLYGITVYRFRDGLIVEDWEAMDQQHLMRQIAVGVDAG